MKHTKIRMWTVALAVALLTPLAPAVAAQNQSPSAQPPAAAQQQSGKKTYYGTIVKLKNGSYGLMIDAKTNRGYLLDSKNKVKKYDQKKVLVTGTLDRQTKTLHVAEVKPAFQPGSGSTKQ